PMYSICSYALVCSLSLDSLFFLSIVLLCIFFFFFTDPAPTEIYTLSLHDALPISRRSRENSAKAPHRKTSRRRPGLQSQRPDHRDRKSTRLNSSHVAISYAVFCLKKKKKKKTQNKQKKKREKNQKKLTPIIRNTSQ